MKYSKFVVLSLVLVSACGKDTKTKTVVVQDPEQSKRIAELEAKNNASETALAQKEADVQERIEAAVSQATEGLVNKQEVDKLVSAAVENALKDKPSEEQIQERIKKAVAEALKDTATPSQVEERINAAVAEALKKRPSDEEIQKRINAAVELATAGLSNPEQVKAAVDKAVAEALANTTSEDEILKRIADAVADAVKGLVPEADVAGRINKAVDEALKARPSDEEIQNKINAAVELATAGLSNPEQVKAAVDKAVAAALALVPTEAEIQERITAEVTAALAGAVPETAVVERINKAVSDALKQSLLARQLEAAKRFVNLVQSRKGIIHAENSNGALVPTEVTYSFKLDESKPCQLTLTEKIKLNGWSYTYFLKVDKNYRSDVIRTEEGVTKMAGMNVFLNGWLPNIGFEANIDGEVTSDFGKGPFLSFKAAEIDFVNSLDKSFGLLVDECGR